MLTLLGWTDRVVQTAVGRSDVPDFLLFPNAAAKVEAVRLARSAERYRQGVTIVEAKAWGLPLDRRTDRSPAPSTHMLRCLGTVEVQSAVNVRFGILTNSRHSVSVRQKLLLLSHSEFADSYSAVPPCRSTT